MPKRKKRIRVGILCGGVSNERDVSLRSGEQVLRNLSTSFQTKIIEISHDGRYWLKGVETNLNVLAKKFDVIFIALHGKYGEDGRIQSVLELAGLPYTGSGVLASALGMDKFKTQEFLRAAGILSPRSLLVTSDDNRNNVRTMRSVRNAVGFPCVVKPNASGSSIGVTIVDRPSAFPSAVERALKEDSAVLLQEYVSGREITCGVMGNSGQTPLMALPVVEIIPEGRFFDYSSKYTSPRTNEICPAQLSARMTKRVQELSKKIHAHLGCDGLTRSDFILTPKGKIYFLEINTIPGLTEQSLCPKEAKAAGMSFSKFLAAQVNLALMRH